MPNPTFQKLKDHRERFGFSKTAVAALERAVNRVIRAECYNIVVLDQAEVREHRVASTPEVSVRVATRDELMEMHKQQTWQIHDFLLDRAAEGDLCFLNYCGGELAGYTWANVNGQPLLFPHLRLKLPDNYIYNYAGFTLPKFRGYGLQAIRHSALIHHKQWNATTRGLIGYVNATNWPSIRGQTKSGYRKIGTLVLVGSKNHFVTFRSRAVRDFGIVRLHDFVPADAKRYSTAS